MTAEPVLHTDGQGPPRPHPARAEMEDLRTLADDAPGLWVSLECTTGKAATRAQKLRAEGYEATARGGTLWVRRPAPQ